MFNEIRLDIPELNTYITPGCKVKLGRFQTTLWTVCHGWYSWGGNREVCGWHLIQTDDPTNLKPLQRTDLDDMYLIER